jgi:pentatricopeptide repeat domain-containing protein 2
VFGPVVMRMYHYLNQPDAALHAFKDPSLEGFFDQLISYQLLMDLLFSNDRYEDVMDVFNIVVQRQTQGARYPKHCVVLAFGALYKMVYKLILYIIIR